MTALLEDPSPAATHSAATRHAPPARAPRVPRGRRLRVAAVVVGGMAVLALGAAQAFLPGLAEQRVAAQLGASGEVASVRISAFPAVKLLWGSADEVSVRMTRYAALSDGGSGDSGESSGIGEMRGVKRLDVAIDVLEVGPVTLRDARLAKDGATVRAAGTISKASVRAALPDGLSLEPSAGPGGRLVLNGAAGMFGVDVDASAAVVAEDGRIVIRPDDSFLSSLAAVTVFEDPAIAVTDVRAHDEADALAVEARASLS